MCVRGRVCERKRAKVCVRAMMGRSESELRFTAGVKFPAMSGNSVPPVEP